MTTPTRSGGRCQRERTEELAGKPSATQFPPLSRPRPGILSYRAPRTPGEVVRCLTEALRREIRIADELDIPVSNDTLRDIISWAERGCMP